MVSRPMHQEAALVLNKLGGESANFSARQLTPRIASGADLILTMTTAHRDAVLEISPRQLHQTFTLTEIVRLASDCGAQTVEDLAVLRPRVPTHELADVPDPIGHGPQVFALVGSQLADLLPPMLEFCRRASGPSSDPLGVRSDMHGRHSNNRRVD